MSELLTILAIFAVVMLVSWVFTSGGSGDPTEGLSLAMRVHKDIYDYSGLPSEETIQRLLDESGLMPLDPLTTKDYDCLLEEMQEACIIEFIRDMADVAMFNNPKDLS